LGGANYRNPQSALDTGDVIFPGINSQTGFTDSFDFSYRRLAICAVPQSNDKLVLWAPLNDTKVGYVALLFEDFRDRDEDLC
jgi:hypothetical protein